MNYSDFFKRAFGGNRTPYAYQCRLACGPEASPERPETLVSGSECQSKLINIPTGLGKTAAVILAWVWNRVRHLDEKHRQEWPRRLVYCLPMRIPDEETSDKKLKWLRNLWKCADELRLDPLGAERLRWFPGECSTEKVRSWILAKATRRSEVHGG